MAETLRRWLHRMAARFGIDRLVARYHRHAHAAATSPDALDGRGRLLHRARHSPWLSAVVGMLAFVSAATGLYPFGPVIVAATVFAPQRWRAVLFGAILGAAAGGVTLAVVIQGAGGAFVDRMFPDIRQHAFWAHATYWIDRHGELALAVIAALPLPQLPVLIVSALAGLSPQSIGAALLAGKLAKYGVYVAAVRALVGRLAHPTRPAPPGDVC